MGQYTRAISKIMWQMERVSLLIPMEIATRAIGLITKLKESASTPGQQADTTKEDGRRTNPRDTALRTGETATSTKASLKTA